MELNLKVNFRYWCSYKNPWKLSSKHIYTQTHVCVCVCVLISMNRTFA